MIFVAASYFDGTRPSPLTRIFAEPGSIAPNDPRLALINGVRSLTVAPSAGCACRLALAILSSGTLPPLDDPPKLIASSKTFGLFASIMYRPNESRGEP